MPNKNKFSAIRTQIWQLALLLLLCTLAANATAVPVAHFMVKMAKEVK